jgi:peroxiredoxin Q/BCP
MRFERCLRFCHAGSIVSSRQIVRIATSIAQATKLSLIPIPWSADMICLRIAAVIAFVITSAWVSGASAQTPANIVVGAAAPDFKLQDQNGQWHTLAEYKGKWLVLYFYPKDQTPGCTTEACEFRDNVFAFRDANAVIVGISVDDVDSHKKFESKHGLPFTLLADANKDVTKSYGVLKKFMGLTELAKRETFLIDPNGHVAKIYRDVDPKGHSQAVLADIKAMEKK